MRRTERFLNSAARDAALVRPQLQYLIPEDPLPNSGFDQCLPVCNRDLSCYRGIDLRFLDLICRYSNHRIHGDAFQHLGVDVSTLIFDLAQTL